MVRCCNVDDLGPDSAVPMLDHSWRLTLCGSRFLTLAAFVAIGYSCGWDSCYRALALRVIADDKAPPKVASQPAGEKLDRTVLPIPEPKPAVVTELDARNVKAPPRFEVKCQKNGPTW